MKTIKFFFKVISLTIEECKKFDSYSKEIKDIIINNVKEKMIIS